MGHKPKWVVNVEHLPTRPKKTTKYQDTTAKILIACTHPDVSDDFTYWNDDFYALKPTRVVPLHRGPVSGVLGYYQNKYGKPKQHTGNYRKGMAETALLLESWGFKSPLSYEVHAPLPVNKQKMADVLRRATAEASIVALHKRTLYGNVYRLGGREVKDCKALTAYDVWPDDWTWVSTSNQAFSGRAGRRLKNLFPDPSPYEET